MNAKRRFRISDAEWQEVLDIRAGLHRAGYDVLPLNEDGKKPLFANWPDFRYDPANPEPAIPRTFNAAGDKTKARHFATGVKTSGLVTVDIDVEDPILVRRIRAIAEAVAGEPGCVRTRDGTARQMLFYRVGTGIERFTHRVVLKGGRGAVECDANHAGQQAQVAGRHPSGAWIEYEGDAPWDFPLSELPGVDMETLMRLLQQIATTCDGEVRGSVIEGGAGNYERRGIGPVAEATVDLLTGTSITPSAETLFKRMLFDFNAPSSFIEEFVRALAREGRRLNPREADRYDHLLKQMDDQGVPLQVAMEKKWTAFCDEQMRGIDYATRADELEKQADAALNARRLNKASRKLQIARLVEMVNGLPPDLIDEAMDFLAKKGGRCE